MTDHTFDNPLYVTKATHPYVYAAFAAITVDNGGVNRVEGDLPEIFQVPEEWAQELATAEMTLATLSPEERETLCNGEFTEIQTLILKYGLTDTDKLLTAFFEGW